MPTKVKRRHKDRVQIVSYIDAKHARLLNQIAAGQGISQTAVVRQIIKAALEPKR